MPSRYLIQILDKETGKALEFEPGLSVEADFVEQCVSRAVAKGVGLTKTANHVADDMRQAVREIIFELKAKVRP